MPAPKQQRATQIISKILRDDEERGTIDPRTALRARMIGDPDGLSARITYGHRFSVAPAYGSRTERQPIRDAKWRAVSIFDRGKEVMAVNVRGTSFHIALYRPGRWEHAFEVD